MALLALLVGVSTYSLREVAMSRSLIAQSIGDEVTLIVRVQSDPHLTRDRVLGSRLVKGKESFLAEAERIWINNHQFSLHIPVRVLMAEREIAVGDQLTVSGRLAKTRERRVASLIVVREILEIRKSQSQITSRINNLRNKFIDLAKRSSHPGAALIPGIVIGDTRLESQQLIDSMRQAGLAHLTAVSGANFAIVTSFVLWLSSWILRVKGLRAGFAAIFVLFFGELVRPTPSVLRAAVMALVIIVARASGSRSTSATSLACAITVVLIADPFQAFDPGFILSVLATAGLIFLAPWLQIGLEKFLIPVIAEGIAISSAATIVCSPYLIYLSGGISLGTIFFNSLVAPVIAPLTIMGFLSMIALPLLPSLSGALFTSAQPMAGWIIRVASLHTAVPQISLDPKVALVAISLLFVAALSNRRIMCGLVAIFIVLILLSRSSIPIFGGRISDWEVAQCDVGQGDALLVNIGLGSAILLDAGPDPKLLRNCLKEFSVKKLPLVVLSHNHADHFQGLATPFDIPIGEVWIGNEGDFSPPTAHRIHIARRGDQLKLGKVRIQILWPITGAESFTSIAGDGSEENNRSIVALIDIDGISLLVTGDIEPAAQNRITQLEPLSGISLLKVPHHGSKYQDQLFLHRISPRVALISVGGGNSYGHPSISTINTLNSNGARVFRTDKDGAVAISWRDVRGAPDYVFSVRTIGKEWWRIRWL